MKPIARKAEAKRGTFDSTLFSGVQNSPKMTARMHFYAVRSAGDQLRWDSAPTTGKKSERMVGR
ncbi:MAG: hypothetical protein ACRD6W_11430 [Nitrososphaerales archaeon]